MTKISAKVIADSKNEFGNRITTMEVIFPRFILAELNTHRMMSRNSASSRAIPFEKMLDAVENNPFIPIAWQKDHKGMQGTEYFTDKEDIEQLEINWKNARDYALRSAAFLSNNGATKQLCNRLLEPFMYHKVLITATEWENFFALRCPKYQVLDGTFYRSWKDVIKSVKDLDITYRACLQADTLERLKHNEGQAEIHMMELAEQMWDAMNESTPKELKAGEWHTPFSEGIDFSHEYWGTITPKNEDDWVNEVKLKIATARCARVSYTVVGEEDKPVNYENDIKLHDKLAESGHWSPFEHCAQAMSADEFVSGFNGDLKTSSYGEEHLKSGDAVLIEKYVDKDDTIIGWSGNFRGFTQYRKTFNNENITK